ncbi:AraC family transcriptional regulator [Nakamurella lactea]|uniref:AraC family transcriptional regulator n=1 Tax=Nakamurella lactea TaxID=459515 RepID=UPI0012B58567|nr:helix-turn-helix domain-containing protein [Nakamurella lactea]
MRSWTNATGHRDGLGDLVHPRQTDLILRRAQLPVTAGVLAEYAEWFWTVAWSRYGAPLRSSEVITSPVCHLTFEDGRRADGRRSVRYGITMPAAVVTTAWTGRFRVQLAGEGRVIGLRFRAGGLAALLGRELPSDRTLPADDLLPGSAGMLPAVLAEPDDLRRRDLIETWLVPQLPEPDRAFVTARDLVEWSVADSSVVRVEQIADRAGLSVRAVQRLFRQFVGVNPKWVLMRARLKDAAAALDSDPDADLADLAVRLGWYDQSHFVRDFRRFLGVTPGRYARDARVDPGPPEP